MKDQQVAAHCCNLAEGSIVEGEMAAPFLTSSVLEQGSSMRFFLVVKLLKQLIKIHHGTKTQYAGSCVFMAAYLQVD